MSSTAFRDGGQLIVLKNFNAARPLAGVIIPKPYEQTLIEVIGQPALQAGYTPKYPAPTINSVHKEGSSFPSGSQMQIGMKQHQTQRKEEWQDIERTANLTAHETVNFQYNIATMADSKVKCNGQLKSPLKLRAKVKAKAKPDSKLKPQSKLRSKSKSGGNLHQIPNNLDLIVRRNLNLLDAPLSLQAQPASLTLGGPQTNRVPDNPMALQLQPLFREDFHTPNRSRTHTRDPGPLFNPQSTK